MSEAVILQIVIVIGVILFSMTLHEAMHGFVAYWLGDDTAKREGRLTLNPIKHIDPFLTIALPVMLVLIGAPVFGGAKPVPFNPNRVRYEEWGAALVALAGPFTNLAIAFVIYGLNVVLGVSSASLGGDIVQTIFAYGIIVNLGFFIFNMIPVPPLDGSRVLYALAPEFARRALEYIEQYGLIFIFVLVLLGSSIISVFMNNAIQFFLDLFSKIFIL